MEGVISGPLAEALRRGRQNYNTRFAIASKAENPIDAAEFQHHLAVTLDPIVRSVAAEFAERVDPVLDALFDLSLELFRHNLLGSRAKYPAIPAAWSELLPQIPRLIAREPTRVAGSITNALYQLCRTPGAKPCAEAFTLSCQSVDEFLNCAAIRVWQCGLPQYRRSALENAAKLPPGLAAQALGVPPEQVRAVIDALQANPWLTPLDALNTRQRELKMVATAGGFRGFTGPFLSPPKVECMEGELIASDGTGSWRLYADIYNTVLLRCETMPPPPPGTPANLRPDGTVQWRGQQKRFPELANAGSAAASLETLAVTIPTSHHLFLVALA